MKNLLDYFEVRSGPWEDEMFMCMYDIIGYVITGGVRYRLCVDKDDCIFLVKTCIDKISLRSGGVL